MEARSGSMFAERPDFLKGVAARQRDSADPTFSELATEADPQPDPITQDEREILDCVRRLGKREALERLILAGPYQAIASAIDRLGFDAVDELRRIIAEGIRPIADDTAHADPSVETPIADPVLELEVHRDPLDSIRPENMPLGPVRQARAEKSRALIREVVRTYEIARLAYFNLEFGSASSRLPLLPRDGADRDEQRRWESLTSCAACFFRDAEDSLASVIEALYNELAPPELQVTDEVEDAYDDRPHRHDYPERGVVIDGVTYVVAARPSENNDDVILRFEGNRIIEV